MFKLMDKKIIAILGLNFLLNWPYVKVPKYLGKYNMLEGKEINIDEC